MAQQVREVALPSKVELTRISPSLVAVKELLKLKIARILMVVAILAVGVGLVAVSRAAMQTRTTFYFGAWAHASVQNQRCH